MDNRASMGIIGTEYKKNFTANQVWYQLIPNKPLLIDFNRKEHMLIVAKSGSGKTYLMGVLAEEITRASQNTGVIMLDMMGVLPTLRIANTDAGTLHAWNQKMILHPIKPVALTNVEIWVPKGDAKEFEPDQFDTAFSMKANQLSYGTLCYCFKMDTLDPQTNLFRKIKRIVKKQNHDYTISDLIDGIHENREDLGFKIQTADALITKLDALVELNLISSQGIDLSEMVQEGKIVVLDLSMSERYTAKIIVNFLAEQLLKTRKKMKNKLLAAKSKKRLINRPTNYIPPVHLLIDEAHNFFPSKILKTYIKEGRNCGCKMTAISQSPDLERSVYANITHLFVGQLTFKDDLARVLNMIPVEREPKPFRAEVKDLDVGNFLYYDLNKKIEKKIRIRPRKSLHPASTEMEDERKHFIETYQQHDNVIEFLKNKGNVLMKDIPSEMKAECAKLIKTGKITAKNEGGFTYVELC
ncbi:ATP-binding protein [Candidatus Lokiarchaeum ossiferum]|uniref:ATP-binding protein n=1 Tax=Candidatus Lokiarchaeum ossiferum TaxID=2951803 RepID=UPI00352C449D